MIPMPPLPPKNPIRSRKFQLALLAIFNFALLTFNCPALTPVQFNLLDDQDQPLTLPITVQGMKLQSSGVYILAGLPIVLKPAAGTITTNLHTGRYTCSVQGISQVFIIDVPDTNTVQFVTSLVLSGAPIYTYTNNWNYSLKLDSNDTTPGFLSVKLLPGANISFQTNNPGANESLTLISTGGSGSASYLRAGTNVQIVDVSGTSVVSVASVPWPNIAGTPTTLGGYGITSVVASNLLQIWNGSALKAEIDGSGNQTNAGGVYAALFSGDISRGTGLTAAQIPDLSGTYQPLSATLTQWAATPTNQIPRLDSTNLWTGTNTFKTNVFLAGTANTASNQVFGANNLLTGTLGDARYAPVSVLGSVTSVAFTVPTGLSISGSPVTTSGTLGLTVNASGTLSLNALNLNSQVTTNGSYFIGGITNAAGAVNTLAYHGAGTNLLGLANGGANTVVHGTTPPAYSPVVEADITTADNTTDNVSTSKHGFAPKGDNNAAHYLDGTGAYSTPAGGSGATGPGVCAIYYTNLTTVGNTNLVINCNYGAGTNVVINAYFTLNTNVYVCLTNLPPYQPTNTWTINLYLEQDGTGQHSVDYNTNYIRFPFNQYSPTYTNAGYAEVTTIHMRRAGTNGIAMQAQGFTP
jgi:hypothetical protein